jgi:peptide/nickel transport system permease protein
MYYTSASTLGYASSSVFAFWIVVQTLDMVSTLPRVVQQPQAIALGFLVLLIVVAAVAGRQLVPYDPNLTSIEDRFLPPSRLHWFGTDDVGRDVFSRTIVGTRQSLVAALLVIVIATSLGAGVGLAAGFVGGWADNALMRLTDLFFAFPALILAIAISAVLGPSLINAVLAVAVVWWPQYSRLVRGRVLSVRHETYVEAARALGVPELRIAVRHVLPQCLTVVAARGTVDIGYAILLTATLGFLGLGAQPPTAEWGSMLALARPYFFVYWWMAFFPGLAILVSVLALGMFGDLLNDVLLGKR